MKILFPVSECVPFAKTGGLADVAGALPKALAQLGHEMNIVLPFYPSVWNSGVEIAPLNRTLSIPLGGQILNAEIWQARLSQGKLAAYFIKYEPFYNRPDLYQHSDNDQRFVFFCRAVMELGKALGGFWDFIHCHDWHTGLIPVYLKTLYAAEPAFAKTRSIMTIHNLAYQGLFDYESFLLTGLPLDLFHAGALEFWGQLNFLKAGIVFADWVTTVSKTHVKEVQTPEWGHALDGILYKRRENFSGIVNGIDVSEWNPETDPFIPFHFNAQTLEVKSQLKSALLTEERMFALEHAPLISIISRLVDHKGFDILAEVIERILGLNAQMILLGTGDKKYHDFFLRIKARFPRKFNLHLTFDNSLAHRIYAGSDMFLMPSRFEPCGLGQLISMRYGCVPIVRNTGGLADTVKDFNGRKGTGFVFTNYTGETLYHTLKRAITCYENPDHWERVTRNAMAENFSWEHSAKEYIELYQKVSALPPAKIPPF